MMTDPVVLVIAALGSVVGALTFVFGLYVKSQDRAYTEMVRIYEQRISDVKNERDRTLVINELSEKNIVAVLGVIKAGVEGVGASMMAQTQTIQTLHSLLERVGVDPRDRDPRDRDMRDRDMRDDPRDRERR